MVDERRRGNSAIYSTRRPLVFDPCGPVRNGLREEAEAKAKAKLRLLA